MPTRKKLKKQPMFNVSAKYAYEYLEPQMHTYDKHGVLVIGSTTAVFEEMQKHPERFNFTTFEKVVPGVCIGAGVLLLAAIIATA